MQSQIALETGIRSRINTLRFRMRHDAGDQLDILCGRVERGADDARQVYGSKVDLIRSGPGRSRTLVKGLHGGRSPVSRRDHIGQRSNLAGAAKPVAQITILASYIEGCNAVGDLCNQIVRVESRMTH